MTRLIPGIALAAALCLLAPPAAAADARIGLSARVPVICTLDFAARVVRDAAGLALGETREMCNGASGYRIEVSYTPGTLKGAVLRAGEASVRLDGSGRAILAESPRPAVRMRALHLETAGAMLRGANLRLSIVPH